MREKKTVRQMYQWASSFLREQGSAAPEFEAELLLRRFLGWERTQFFLGWDQWFPVERMDEWNTWLSRRANGEPIQYILGDQEFYGRRFSVNPAVLIPRPETELLVEHVMAEGRKLFGDQPITVVDVGTGSGCIAITLALECPHWQIIAVDLSEQAISVAKENAKHHGVMEKIKWLRGDLLTPLLEQKIPFSVLVSNPPYIPTAQIPRLEKQVAQFEPHLALDGGTDGLDPYRRMVDQLAVLPVEKRLVAFEIGDGQGKEVARLLLALPGVQKSEIRFDLAGRERFVIGWMDKI